MAIQVQSLIEAAERELKLKGYSTKTRKAYISQIKKLIAYVNKDILELNLEDIRQYLLNILEVKKKSHSDANQAISAIKFLFNDVLMTF